MASFVQSREKPKHRLDRVPEEPLAEDFKSDQGPRRRLGIPEKDDSILLQVWPWRMPGRCSFARFARRERRLVFLWEAP